MDELANWYRGAQAELIQLRTQGSTLREQHFDLRYHPGETGAPRLTECADPRHAIKIRGDELMEAGWIRRIETDFSALNAELAAHEPFNTWARITRRELPLQTLFEPWWLGGDFQAFTRSGFHERAPGEGFCFEAEWESRAGPVTLLVGPPASPRALSTLAPIPRAVFAAHSYVSLFSVDDEFPRLELTLFDPWALRCGGLRWRLDTSGQLVAEDDAPQPFIRTLSGQLVRTFLAVVGT